jgi:pimeloyl-ACP methyl ester carboxylesterase
MLVHGFPADGNLWHHVMTTLSGSFRLLVPDLPGSGLSPTIDSLSIEDMAELLCAILDQQAVEQCVLVGHSMGGYAALAFAEQYPDRLQGLGLFHSSALPDSEEKKKGRARSIELIRRYGGAGFLRQMIPGLFSARYRTGQRAALQELIRQKSESDPTALITYYRAMMQRPDRIHVLEQTKVPVLFVIGEEDGAVQPEDVLKQVLLPRVSTAYWLKETAHMGMLEKPDTSVGMLDSFMRFCVQYPF